MQAVDENKVVIEYICGECEETQTDLMVNVIDNGAPLCLNELCKDGYHRETSLNRVWVED